MSDSGTPQSGPRELLPDFDQRPPFRLTIAGTKLGFASATDNIGDGPVGRGRRGSALAPMRAQQLSAFRTEARVPTPKPGGFATPSPSHTHWHLLDFQRYELRTQEGKVVVRDHKSGFCLADHYGLARRRVAIFTGGRFFGNCAASNPAALSVEQGRRWASPISIRPTSTARTSSCAAFRPDLTLVHRANPEQRLEEVSYTNNAASLRIRLTWNGGAPAVETLRSCEGSERC